jgi:hypothetical protein
MGGKQSPPALKATGFEPRELERQEPLAKFARSESRYKGMVESNRGRVAAGLVVEQEAPGQADWLFCRHCCQQTRHASVYWYTAQAVYRPPLVTIFGYAIGSVEAPVYVLWCTRHRGEPPARYPAPTPTATGAG